MSNIGTYIYGTNPVGADGAYKLPPIHQYWGPQATHDMNRGVVAASSRQLSNSRTEPFTVTLRTVGIHSWISNLVSLPEKYISFKLNLLRFNPRSNNPTRNSKKYRALKACRFAEKACWLTSKLSPLNSYQAVCAILSQLREELSGLRFLREIN